MNPSSPVDILESYQCSKNKKCGWVGTLEEQKLIPDPLGRHGLGGKLYVCPNCGNHSFYKLKSAEEERLARAAFSKKQRSYTGIWIPCNERLPDSDRWVLVTCIGEGGDLEVVTARYSRWVTVTPGIWRGVDHYAITDVLTWTPFPKACSL